MKSSFLRFLGIVFFGVTLFAVGFTVGGQVRGTARAQAPAPTPSSSRDSVPGGFHVRGAANILQSTTGTISPPYAIGPCVAHKTCHFQFDFHKGKGMAFEVPCQAKAACLRFTSDKAVANVDGYPGSTYAVSITINLKK
jgi:hypothetical protein